VRARALLHALALGCVLAVAAGGCASGQAGRPCTAGSCGSGRACVVGECRAPEATPSPADSQRLLLPPSELAVLTSKGGSGAGTSLPAVVALGSEAAGAVVVLLRFAPTWRDDADVVSAFVLLEPRPFATPPSGPVPIEVARVLEAWSPETVSWGRQPRMALPVLATTLRPEPPRSLRVDVTSLVKGWRERRDDDHGIAVLAAGDDPFGSSYATGVDGGVGPRLEVYLR
jgi:hypothetical protein